MSFVDTQLNSFKSSKQLNSSIWPKDGTQIGSTILGQSGPESNGKDEILPISQTPRLAPHHQMQFNVLPWRLTGFK